MIAWCTDYSTDTSLTTLWHQILSKSGLAKALSEVFLSISTSKIAHVFINEAFDVSLQIPQVVSIADLPTAIEPQMPGVWLTTANSIENDELDGITLAKHFALLLLDDVGDILRDIDHEHGPKEVSHPLAEFVQLVKPTMSYVAIVWSILPVPAVMRLIFEDSCKCPSSTTSRSDASSSCRVT